MKIEFLYFDSCPNHKITLKDLRMALEELSLKEEIRLTQVTNDEEAVIHRFLGSPSIRINDRDLEITEDEATEYSMRCRRYQHGDEIAGYPERKLIINVLKANMK